jgi:SulP family sulfate permease
MKITTQGDNVRVFSTVDDAQVWVEDRILNVDRHTSLEQPLLELHEMELFKGRKEESISALEACMEQRSCKAGEKIYSTGDPGDRLFLIRRGTVRMILPSDGSEGFHLATYSRGDFFGGLSFLDGQPRGNEAIAQTDTELFVLRRESFDELGDRHKRLTQNLFEAIAGVLSRRLRYGDMELAALRD